MLTRLARLIGAIIVSVALSACLGEDETQVTDGPDDPTGPSGGAGRPPDANRFLLFLNQQNGLAAGDYRVVVATAQAGLSGTFTLIITFDDGSQRVEDGSWSGSGGTDPDSAANPAFELRLQRPGGITIEVESALDSYLYLLDATGSVLAEDDNNGPGDDAMLLIAGSRINSAQYATAYYKAIDPNDERTTLADWLTVNGFDQGADAEVLFRDVKDLGYGRWMFMRRRADGGFAFYVHNFQVSVIPGQEYSRLNLDAAVADDRRWHIGTNAIEYGPDADGRFFVRFLTFAPADANGVQRRALSADLDGRGEKFMPILCITCHGGSRLPVLRDGEFPDGGYIDAQLQALEPDSFEFAEVVGRRRVDQEAAMKFINQAVYDSFATPGTALPGSHDGEFLRELLAGWYGGVDAQGQLIDDEFDGEFVPPGWRPDPADGSPPSGADELYLSVLAPSCIVCHARRGSNLQSDVNFSSYEKFIAHADQIQELVYDRGVMPAAFLHYQDFWDPTGLKAQLLGALLPGFDRGRDDGSTLRPGRPIADPGPDRTARPPVDLSAAASRFARAYRWRVIATPVGGESASLSGADGPLARLETDVDGEYRLELVVSDGEVDSEPAELVVTVDSAAPLYSFESDVRPILQSDCILCHAPVGVRTDDRVDGIPVIYTDNEFLYQDVLQRVDLEDPENSLILLKPSGHHHFGEQRTGFNRDDPLDRQSYHVILHWILQGAPQRRD